MSDIQVDRILATDVSLVIHDGRVWPFFPKGRDIPIKTHKKVAPNQLNEDSIEMHFVQGDSPVASENRTVGKWKFSGFPVGENHDDRVRELSFAIDGDGLLTVTPVPEDNGLTIHLLEGDAQVEYKE